MRHYIWFPLICREMIAIMVSRPINFYFFKKCLGIDHCVFWIQLFSFFFYQTRNFETRRLFVPFKVINLCRCEEPQSMKLEMENGISSVWFVICNILTEIWCHRLKDCFTIFWFVIMIIWRELFRWRKLLSVTLRMITV